MVLYERELFLVFAAPEKGMNQPTGSYKHQVKEAIRKTNNAQFVGGG